MKVLVACEFSGRVREAFSKKGHNAYSCDLLPTEIPSPYHIQDDVLNHLNEGWDMMIAHPPCTYLSVSGARWFSNPVRAEKQRNGLDFVKKLMNAPINKIAIENPISVISTYIRRPDQIIQPWQFGHGETKATCLWLQNLSRLQPMNIVVGRIPRVHNESPAQDRWKNRSRTYEGIAEAMASQWGFSSEEK